MSSGEPAGSLVLIDAHSLIFQVFHAIPEMSSPAGLPTNAVFGFTRDILFLLGDQKPTYLICAFDPPGPTFRDKLYAAYKANRAPLPNDLRPQFELIQRMLEAMRVPVISIPGYEADDVIATLAGEAARRGLKVLICTSDKDCRQLIQDNVHLYNLRKREAMDCESLLRDWAIRPEQVVDLQALVGDPVDNVPGVPGIGLKTAAKLLQEHQTLDNLLANADKVAGAKTKENLKAWAEKVLLSRQLVRLATDVPLPFDWEGWQVREPDRERLLALFQEWGFHRLADQVRAQTNAARQQELFPHATTAAPATAANGALPARGSALNRVLQAETDLEFSQDRTAWMQRMNRKGFSSAGAVQSEESHLENSRYALDKARDELRVLQKYEHKRSETQLVRKLSFARDELHRQQLQARAKKAQAEVNRFARMRIYQRRLGRFQEIEEELKQCTIRAPHDGLAVYAVPEGGWSVSASQTSVIAAGEPVRTGQCLLTIPNLRKMEVRVGVHEALISRIHGEQASGGAGRRPVKSRCHTRYWHP